MINNSAKNKNVAKALSSKGLQVPQNKVSYCKQKAFVQVAVKQYRNR